MSQHSVDVELGDGHLALFWSDRWNGSASPCLLRRINTLPRYDTIVESVGALEGKIHHLVSGARSPLDLGQETPSWTSRLARLFLLLPGKGDMRPPLRRVLLRQASLVRGGKVATAARIIPPQQLPAGRMVAASETAEIQGHMQRSRLNGVVSLLEALESAELMHLSGAFAGAKRGGAGTAGRGVFLGAGRS